MNKFLILCSIFFSSVSWALTPIDGIILGDVRNTNQLDPLKNIFKSDIVNFRQQTNIQTESYISLYKTGFNLKRSCELPVELIYNSQWQKDSAIRSIVSHLQFIGIDMYTKALGELSHLVDIDDNSFQKIAQSLVNNYCSENITVYSKKMILKNLLESRNRKGFITKFTKGVFPDELMKLIDTKKFRENEFQYSLKGFRSFCSWNNNVESFRLLTKYLKNPFVMGYLFNTLEQKRYSFDDKSQAFGSLVDTSIQRVACEGYICRARKKVAFKQLFPRIVGSTRLYDDLSTNYCSFFAPRIDPKKDKNKVISSILNTESELEKIIEVQYFLSLLTKVPEPFLAIDRVSDIKNILRTDIRANWNKWAKGKADKLASTVLYEEALQIDIESQVGTSQAIKGNFRVIFDYTLGEVDRSMAGGDKISSTFNLNFSLNFLRWVRSEFIKQNNKSNFVAVEMVKDKFSIYISRQLKKKEKYFLKNVWTKQMVTLIRDDLLEQIVNYKGSKLKEFSNKKIIIPVKFRYGIFALRYLFNKSKSLKLQEIVASEPSVSSYKK